MNRFIQQTVNRSNVVSTECAGYEQDLNLDRDRCQSVSGRVCDTQRGAKLPSPALLTLASMLLPSPWYSSGAGFGSAMVQQRGHRRDHINVAADARWLRVEARFGRIGPG